MTQEGGTTPARTHGRVALVIGNSAYPEPLRNPVNDARVISEQLVSAGFRIIGGVSSESSPGRDVTAERLRGMAEAFLAAIRKGTVAVIYYAGHGVQIGEQNFLVPIDARLDGGDPLLELVPLSWIVERASERAGESGRVVVLLDACRNNPFQPGQIEGLARAISARSDERGGGEEQAATARARGLAKVRLSRPERVAPQFIAFATAPGEVAYDGDDGDPNSPFAAALARHIPVRGLPMSALIDRVGLDVEAKVAGMGLAQDPWCTTNLKEPMYIRPRTWAPLFEMTALGALAGLAICALLFYGGSFINPYTASTAWAWALGLVFAGPLAIETVRWGDGQRSAATVWRDAMFVLLGGMCAFAMGLVALRLIMHAQTVRLGPGAVEEAQIATAVFDALALATGVLMMMGTLMCWTPQRRTLNGWITRIIIIAAPFVLTGVMTSFGSLLLNPERSAAVLLSLVAGILFAAGTAISCIPLGGLFRTFAPLTGAIVVGLWVAVFFLAFDHLRVGGPDQLLLAGIGLGAGWFGLLGAQLGYCLVYYVPDHRPRPPVA